MSWPSLRDFYCWNVWDKWNRTSQKKFAVRRILSDFSFWLTFLHLHSGKPLPPSPCPLFLQYWLEMQHQRTQSKDLLACSRFTASLWPFSLSKISSSLIESRPHHIREPSFWHRSRILRGLDEQPPHAHPSSPPPPHKTTTGPPMFLPPGTPMTAGYMLIPATNLPGSPMLAPGAAPFPVGAGGHPHGAPHAPFPLAYPHMAPGVF